MVTFREASLFTYFPANLLKLVIEEFLKDAMRFSSSKKLIVFGFHLECGIKRLISLSVWFDVYLTGMTRVDFQFCPSVAIHKSYISF